MLTRLANARESDLGEVGEFGYNEVDAEVLLAVTHASGTKAARLHGKDLVDG